MGAKTDNSEGLSRQLAEARFADLYAEHGRELLAYALRRAPGPEDAADAIAETFLVAWRRAPEVPPGSEARLWLYGVARRTLANQRRGERRRERLTERMRAELTVAAAAQPAPGAEAAPVLHALDRLDEDDRELLLLVGWEELSPSEAARVLGISAVAARSRLHRARRRLRRALEEIGESGGTPGAAAELRTRLTIAALLCLLIAGSAFTTPGRAVTGWVGEAIGFGEVGGPPSLRQLRASWGAGTAAEGQPAYVLHVGPVPGGGRYEFITYEPRAPAGKHWELEGPCFELDFTQERGMANAGCGVLPEGGDLYSPGAGGNYDPDQELHYVAGRTSAAVSSVRARFEGRPAEVELVSISEELVRRLHLGRPFKFFIAFFDDAGHGGTVKVTARDGAGRVVGRSSSELPDARLMYEPMCRHLRSRKHANAAALEDCDQVLGPAPSPAVDSG